jgi:hypothetical protein
MELCVERKGDINMMTDFSHVIGHISDWRERVRKNWSGSACKWTGSPKTTLLIMQGLK